MPGRVRHFSRFLRSGLLLPLPGEFFHHLRAVRVVTDADSFRHYSVAMRRNLKRYYGAGHFHFITCSCYRRPGAPGFAPVFWALTWAPLYSARHVRSVASHALCEGWDSTLPRATALLPTFFHHIFLVRSSQTCAPIGATIPRQRTIENCARLQRRTRFGPQTFHRYLTTYLPGQHPPASARQTAKCNAKSHLLNTLPLTILLSST